MAKAAKSNLWDVNSFLNPDPVLVLIGLSVAFIFTIFQLLYVGKDSQKHKKRRHEEFLAREADKKLKIHVKEHLESKKKLIKVEGDIFIASGYGASTCTFIKGDA